MDFKKLDPEFMERFENFAFHEVTNEESMKLDDETMYIAILASLIGCQGEYAYKQMLQKALERGVSHAAIKEIVYQSVDYMGMGRMWQFLKTTNEVFIENSISMPLESQSTTTFDDRLEKGAALQAEIFGEQMREAWKAGVINKWLAQNCFGDYYTRKGLDIAKREMITFCFLAAQGGCESQLIAHAKGNMNLGNDKEFLIKVVHNCLPYIGYPRSLNAIAAINKAAEE